LTPPLRDLADNLWALHSNGSDYPGFRLSGQPEALKRYNEVFTSTVYETLHPLVRVHPGTGERSLLLGHFVQKIVGLSSADSAQLFALFQGPRHSSGKYSAVALVSGELAMWDNRATQHTAVDDYGNQPRVLRRVTIAGDIPVSVDGKNSVLRKRVSAVPLGIAGAADRP
jgi:alpha-ketoglutarate-dependent sulfate ester dioxygenase